MKYLCLLPFIFILIISCSSSKKSSSEKSTSDIVMQEEIKDIVLPSFSFRTGACFGYCPIFEIKVDSSGRTTLYGERFTYPVGIFSDQLSIDQKYKLLNLIDQINWDEVPERYESRIADTQSYRFVYNDSISTSGDFSMPEGFQEIRMFFIDLEQNSDWTETEDENYTKEEKNDGAFVRFNDNIDPTVLAKKHPFLERTNFTNVDKVNNVYLLTLFDTNLDYDALKEQLINLEITKSVMPIYVLKKKKKGVMSGSLEK